MRAKLARVAAKAEADVASAYRVLLMSGDDLAAVAQRIAALTGAAPAVAEGEQIRTELTAAQLEEITGWGEVQWVEPYSRPRLWNDVAVRTNMMNVSNCWSVLGLTGAGQTIAVCDTGLDSGNTGTLHRDFTNRVTGFGWSNGSYSASYSWADYDEHGTHVSGSVLGNGTMSTGLYKGVAYEANLIIQGSQLLVNATPFEPAGIGYEPEPGTGDALARSARDVWQLDESRLDNLRRHGILENALERLHARLSLPVVYVSHDITEIERLADHLVLMQAGKVLAVGPLAELQSDPKLPLAIARDAAVNFDAEVESYDSSYGLVTLQIDGGRLLVPSAPAAGGELRRVRIAASDVSLARELPQASSILNAVAARIVTTSPVGANEMLVVLALGREGHGGRLLARLSRRSWDLLRLAEGVDVYAQIKGVALAPGRDGHT